MLCGGNGEGQGMKVEKITKNTSELGLDISKATLLTVEEVRKLPERLKRYNDRWWLRSPGSYSCHVAIVNYSGSIDYEASCINVIIRPVLIISNLESTDLEVGDTFEFGNKEFEVISNDKAFCLTDIGRSVFRDDWKADDANDYEKSDIKKYIDEWFEK